jgi:hypothetical protein
LEIVFINFEYGMMIMKINWKDFVLMYVIWLIWFFVSGALFLIIPIIPSILWTFIILALPLAFYFWRNRCLIVDAGVISFTFGVTSILLLFLLGELYRFIMVSFSDVEIVSPTMGVLDITTIIIQLILIGLISMISGLVVWFAINKLQKKK